MSRIKSRRLHKSTLASGRRHERSVVILRPGDAVNILKADQKFEEIDLCFGMIPHLQRDYSDSVGILKLGFHVIRPAAVATFEINTRGGKHRLVNAELLVLCEEGCISRDEAIGTCPVMTQAEILEAATRERCLRQEMPIHHPEDWRGVDGPGIRYVRA